MIAVTGASGQLGSLVIKNLVKKTSADNILALVRSLDSAEELKVLGVQLRVADYDKPETFEEALKGVDKLMLISSNNIETRTQQHKTVVDAAVRAGVNALVYTSILKASTSPMKIVSAHKETENYIKASGLNAVVLRNGWYTENYTQSVGAALEHGVVLSAAGKGIFSTAARNDYAEAAANILVDSEQHIGQVYELAGDQGFTLGEYAAEVAKQSGKEVALNEVSEQELAGILEEIGLPAIFADMLADAETGASNGWLEDNSKTLSKLIGRPTVPMTETLAQALSA